MLNLKVEPWVDLHSPQKKKILKVFQTGYFIKLLILYKVFPRRSPDIHIHKLNSGKNSFRQDTSIYLFTDSVHWYFSSKFNHLSRKLFRSQIVWDKKSPKLMMMSHQNQSGDLRPFQNIYLEFRHVGKLINLSFWHIIANLPFLNAPNQFVWTPSFWL